MAAALDEAPEDNFIKNISTRIFRLLGKKRTVMGRRADAAVARIRLPARHLRCRSRYHGTEQKMAECGRPRRRLCKLEALTVTLKKFMAAKSESLRHAALNCVDGKKHLLTKATCRWRRLLRIPLRPHQRSNDGLEGAYGPKRKLRRPGAHRHKDDTGRDGENHLVPAPATPNGSGTQRARPSRAQEFSAMLNASPG